MGIYVKKIIASDDPNTKYSGFISQQVSFCMLILKINGKSAEIICHIL
jgi:hypothetical protein